MELTIALPAVLDLAAAETLMATLRQRLAAGKSCRLDASNVEQLMLPGMQVILAAIRSSEKVQVMNPSALFDGAFADAALSYVRGDETQIAQAPPQAPPQEPPRSSLSNRLESPCWLRATIRNPIPTWLPSSRSSAKTPRRPWTVHARPSEFSPSMIPKTMRDMLRMTLVDAGYVVIQAVDGQDGLDVLRKERFDVVITDINMPKLDGYGVIRHLRADASYDDTPILVLSTENDQKTKDIGRDAGATGWLVKPFDPDQLVEIVRQVSP